MTEYSGSAILENKNLNRKLYIVLNKPESYVCSYVSDSHKTVYDLLPKEFRILMNQVRGKKLHTVGRLDCETTGLLFLTTDGYFSNSLTRPQSHIKKTYYAKLKLPVLPSVQQEYKERFSKGILLPAQKKFSEQMAASSKIEFLSPDECLVTVTEGKFHQVRRMFLAVENEVTALSRTKIGCFSLPKDLRKGEILYFWR